MFNFSKKELVVTHDGNFHADDVFAGAIISLYFEKVNKKFEIIRTRDRKIIERANIVFDVGEIYDGQNNRFDHHQKGRAGARENGIMYAASGLVWKHFGEKLTNKVVVEILDNRIFSPLDAVDNGQELGVSNFSRISPYSIPSIVAVFNPTWQENDEEDKIFIKLVSWTKELLKREIISAEASYLAESDISKKYEESEDKKIIILEKNYSRYEINRVLAILPEPIYFVYPKGDGSGWKAECVRVSPEKIENRKSFPSGWAAMRGEDLQKVSGVADAVFCHDGLFVSYAKSKEGAIGLAKNALKS